MPGALRCRTGKQRIIASLMACAPWLPPNTSKVGVPPRLGAISKNACRTGTPVTSAWRKYFAVSSKCTAAAETNRATIRLANPGTTLLEPQVVHTAASAEASSHSGSGESQRAQGTGIGNQTCCGEYGAAAAPSA